MKILRRLIIHYQRIFQRSVYRSKFQLPKYFSNDFGWKRGTPIDRYYLHIFLDKNRKFIRGKCLEFGEDTYTKYYGKDVTNSQIFTSILDKKVREDILVGDIVQIETLPSDEFDCIICTNVLNFIYDIHSAVIGLNKMLKPGGVCIISIAGHASHISKYDMDRWGDYWRMSDKSASLLFENAGFNIEYLESHGNAYAASAQMLGYCLEDVDLEEINSSQNEYQMIITMRIRKGELLQ